MREPTYWVGSLPIGKASEMPVRQVAWNKVTGVATVQNNNAAVPSGSVKIGTYNHPENDNLGWQGNHVMFHHVRDLLYFQKEYDMQRTKIMNATT